MTPEQMEMMQLRDTSIPFPDHQDPQVQVVQEPQVDEVNQGLAQTVAYMAKNGPTRPTQRGRAKQMTKAQLEEQKMNEQAGLPSNLEEASRVVALEQKIQNVDLKLDQIIGAITGNLPRMSEVEYTVPRGHPLSGRGPLPTPQVRPAAEPPQQGVYPGQLSQAPPTSPQVVRPTVTQIPEVQESPPDTSPQSWQPPASQETRPLTSPVSIGPVGSPALTREQTEQILAEHAASAGAKHHESMAKAFYGIGEESPGERPVIEEPLSPGEDFDTIEGVIEEDEPTQSGADLAELKRLERQQILTGQVSSWLNSKDPHKFWRQFLSGACNKNLSYNTWPSEFIVPFDNRFSQMIQDQTFISTLCGRILQMQNGHLVAPHVAGAFIVATAGFLSFALIEG